MKFEDNSEVAQTNLIMLFWKGGSKVAHNIRLK